MFPEESNKIKRYVGGLPDMIHGSVVASKPKTMQEAIEIEIELMDKKIHTFVERQTKNKRNKDDNHQQPQQRQENKRDISRGIVHSWKNNNRGNQGGNGNALAKVYA
ncbi:hypothetical protein Tco_1206266, partial [Tanacetum coccineum]